MATIGSISILFIHTATHVGHLKITSKTSASKTMVVVAVLLCCIAMVLAMISVGRTSDHVVYTLIGLASVALLAALYFQKVAKKHVIPRTS